MIPYKSRDKLQFININFTDISMFTPTLITRASIAILLCSIFLTLTTHLYAQQNASITPDTVIAKLNGEELRYNDIIAMAISLNIPEQQIRNLPVEAFRQLLDQLLQVKIMANHARELKMDETPIYAERSKLLLDSLLRDIYVKELIAQNITDAALQEQYNTLAQDQSGREQIRASHILVADEAKAQELIAQLDKGADFAALAKEHSTGPSGVNGGDLNYFDGKQMVPEFSKAAFALNVGQFTKKPVQTQFGWHVIKLTDRRIQSLQPFEQVKDNLRQQLATQLLQQQMDELQKKYNIEILLK